MYPESLIWKAVTYVGTLAAVIFFTVGYTLGLRKRRNWRLDTRHANKPLPFTR